MPPHFQNVIIMNPNLPHEKVEHVVINLDEHASIGDHQFANYVKNDAGTYFDSFNVEHVSKEIKQFTDHEIINANIFRVQAYDSIISEYFCIQFINLC